LGYDGGAAAMPHYNINNDAVKQAEFLSRYAAALIFFTDSPKKEWNADKD